MSAPTLSKVQINGYQLVSVNCGPWTVCTKRDRLASFTTRQEAMAYAAALPVRSWNPSHREGA
ncbi:DUF2188 domain-containing protein [Pseudomonas sp. NPDC089734]|uniref:DUF2188 domain-containing protein n=1 Tax=Pseudomonas sp. NPDC089734 TaxID=3364469 RepID=UPI00381C1669